MDRDRGEKIAAQLVSMSLLGPNMGIVWVASAATIEGLAYFVWRMIHQLLKREPGR